MKQKHRQKPTKKHKTNTTTQKQKFAPENFFKKRPLERRNDKKRQKTPNQTSKTQNDKNEQHFPLGGTQTSGTKLCDSTVAGQSSPPPPSWAVLYSVLQEGGGGGETESVCQGRHTGYRSPPVTQKTIVISILKGAKDV